MILRHAREPIDGQLVENTFFAVDERTGDQLGAAVLYIEENPTLYPVRPMQIHIQLDGPTLPDALLGAAVARAKDVAMRSGQFCRIYTHCAPDDDALLEQLTLLGFRDNDGLIRMQLRLPAGQRSKAPAGCAVVRDQLEDTLEQKYFLERYNRLFNTQHDLAWLRQYIDRRDFQRILTVAPTGMAGEVLLWREGYSGVIGYIQTAKRWRRLGVGAYMLSLACEAFEQQNLYCAEANIRARFPHMLKLMSGAGFTQSELLMRYPGIDVNPGED